MFDFHKINFKIVLIISIVALLTFFGGKYLFNYFGINQPLISKIENIEEVEAVELVSNSSKIDIEISLKNSVSDFYNFYNDVNKIAVNHLGDDLGEIKILDNKNTKLEEVYYNSHFYIYEGIALRKYTFIQENVDKVVNDSQITSYNLWIDQDYVYLELIDNDDYFYKIIPQTTFSNNEERGENIG